MMSEAIGVFTGALLVRFAKSLQQLSAQYAGEAKNSRTKQHDAAGFRGGSRTGNGERFRRNRTYVKLGGQRRAAVRLAAGATVLVPVGRVAAGILRVHQVEPVGLGTEADIQARGCDQINVVAKLVGGNELIG